MPVHGLAAAGGGLLCVGGAHWVVLLGHGIGHRGLSSIGECRAFWAKKSRIYRARMQIVATKELQQEALFLSAISMHLTDFQRSLETASHNFRQMSSCALN
jgi:hypothetical protein